MKPEHKTTLIYIIIIILLISTIICHQYRPKNKIVTVGIIPDLKHEDTYLKFENRTNISIDRFMTYIQIGFKNMSVQRLNDFLYNQSLNHIPEIAIEVGEFENYAWKGAYDLTPLANVTRGSYDDVLYQWAYALKTYDDKYHKIVYIRPFTEFYGDWNPWGIYQQPNNRSDFIPAYKHIVDILRSTGNEDLRFQLNIGGETAWGRAYMNEGIVEPYSLYYPGDDYVDEFSIDVYNTYNMTEWISFYNLTKHDYDELANISKKPAINIGETSSSNEGGNKSQWILDTYKSILCDFPRMKNVDFFFDQIANDNTSNFDLNSPEEVEAFREGVAMVKKYNSGDHSVCKNG